MKYNKFREIFWTIIISTFMVLLIGISVLALVNTIKDIKSKNEFKVIYNGTTDTEDTTTPEVVNSVTTNQIEEPTTSEDYTQNNVRYIAPIITYIEESNEEASEDEPEIVEDTVDPEELEMLAITIYNEAGDMINCSDDTRLKVGNVVLNRIAHPGFPDTMYEVLTDYRQYGMFYWTGIVWADRGDSPEEQKAKENAYAIARRLLEGERVFDSDVIWQAEFFQGTELVSYQDGIYFCK